jgi:predicted dehydrogenase
MMVHQPYRVGIVGAGNILKMHMEGMRRHPDRLVPAALCDVDAVRLRAAADKWSIPAHYEKLEDMLCNEALDAVVVVTPSHIRRDVLEPIMEKHIPVFCEKPLAETYSEAASIAAAAARLGAVAAVNQNFRRFFAFEMARERLAAGTVGKPRHLSQTVLGWRRDQGWRMERDRYVMSVMSIHWLDGYRYLFNEDPRSVYCSAAEFPDISADTAVSVTLDFPSGVLVSLNESFSSRQRYLHACLDCESGSLLLDYKGLVQIAGDGTREEIPNRYDKPEATVSLLLDLCEAAAENRQPLTSMEDNLRSMRLLEAAYRSLTEKRIVNLEEIQ